MWVLCIRRSALSFLPGANSLEQATFLLKSYMTVNAGPCRLLGCFILSGLNQQDNLRSFNNIPVLLLVKSIMALTKLTKALLARGRFFWRISNCAYSSHILANVNWKKKNKVLFRLESQYIILYTLLKKISILSIQDMTATAGNLIDLSVFLLKGLGFII